MQEKSMVMQSKNPLLSELSRDSTEDNRKLTQNKLDSGETWQNNQKIGEQYPADDRRGLCSRGHGCKGDRATVRFPFSQSAAILGLAIAMNATGMLLTYQQEQVLAATIGPSDKTPLLRSQLEFSNSIQALSSSSKTVNQSDFQSKTTTLIRSKIEVSEGEAIPELPPLKVTQTTPVKNSPGQIYTVKARDTLNEIALRHGTSREQLIQANNLQNPDLIFIAQKLKIPAIKETDSLNINAPLNFDEAYKPRGRGLNRIHPPVNPVLLRAQGTALHEVEAGSAVSGTGLSRGAKRVPQPLRSTFDSPLPLGETKSITLQKPEVTYLAGVPTKSLDFLQKLGTGNREQATGDWESCSPFPVPRCLPLVKGTFARGILNLSSFPQVKAQITTVGEQSNKIDTQKDYLSNSHIAQLKADLVNLLEQVNKSFGEKQNLQPHLPKLNSLGFDVSQSEESLIGTALTETGNPNQLLTTLIEETVTPELPPLSSPEQYLPSSPPEFDGYIWPAKGILTSGYGWRRGRPHRGIDIAAPIGTPIIAAASGEVIFAGWNSGGYGNLVKVKHPDSSVTLYAHNNRILVRQGQRVEQGQQIAELGSTGYSTGPHLHFEIHPNGQTAVNPMAYLP